MASCIYVTAVIVKSITTANRATAHIAILPLFTKFTVDITSTGILEIIPINIIIELPLPNPFSVILSPIYIRSILADTNVNITVIIKNALSLFKAPLTIPSVIAIA